MLSPLYSKNLISVETLNRKDVEFLFNRSDSMKKLVEKKGGDRRLKGKVLAALFYEPSSRTFSSFITAVQRLGGGFIPLNDMSKTSAAKGETLEDTVRVFSAYADCIAIRHPEAGSIAKAADFSTKPIINAGDGVNEHPTQAILDLYTIYKKLGRIDNFHITFLGDLGHYRPVNSLSKLMTICKNVKMTFVAPKEVSLQEGVKKYLKANKVSFDEQEKLGKVLSKADVLYVTRVKKEYMSEELYLKVQGQYIIGLKEVSSMKKKSLIMHPLPRVDEIEERVDQDTRAVYLSEQLKSGLYVRMAFLDLILRK